MVGAVALLVATATLAPVSPVVGYPNNYLNVATGWANDLVLNQAYGAAFASAASSGTTSVGYDSTPGPTFGTLRSSTVSMSQFTASANPSGPGTVTNSGLLRFTPVVNCQYAISGYLLFAFIRSFAAAGPTGTMTLEEIGGPVIAGYSPTLVGVPNSSCNSGVLFDSSAPITGSQTGSLTAGVAYRWTWSFSTYLTPGSDPLARATLANATSGFGLSFAVPAPGAAALLGLAGVMTRRRRA